MAGQQDPIPARIKCPPSPKMCCSPARCWWWVQCTGRQLAWVRSMAVLVHSPPGPAVSTCLASSAAETPEAAPCSWPTRCYYLRCSPSRHSAEATLVSRHPSFLACPGPANAFPWGQEHRPFVVRGAQHKAVVCWQTHGCYPRGSWPPPSQQLQAEADPRLLLCPVPAAGGGEGLPVLLHLLRVCRRTFFFFNFMSRIKSVKSDPDSIE